jgi:hypothetical protein
LNEFIAMLAVESEYASILVEFVRGLIGGDQVQVEEEEIGDEREEYEDEY